MGTTLEPGRDASSKYPASLQDAVQLGSGSGVSCPVCRRHRGGGAASPWPPAQPARARRHSFAKGFSLAMGATPPHLCGRPGTLGTLSRNNPQPVMATADGCVPQLPPPPGGTALRCLHSASQRPRRDKTPVACSDTRLTPAGCPPSSGSLPSAPSVLPGLASPTDACTQIRASRSTSGGTQAKTPPSSLRLRVLCTFPRLERGHPRAICFPGDSDPAVLITNMCGQRSDASLSTGQQSPTQPAGVRAVGRGMQHEREARCFPALHLSTSSSPLAIFLVIHLSSSVGLERKLGGKRGSCKHRCVSRDGTVKLP